MTLPIDELGQTIQAALPEDVMGVHLAGGELVVTARMQGIVDVLTYLRDDSNCMFKQLMDICGVDFPDRERRFEVVYNLLSMKHNQRIRVKLAVDEGDAVPTVTGVFSTAGWFEREVYDMYGIPFDGHPDLRRILTDYNFEGYPLRKDFPLTGYYEVRYDDQTKRIVYEPVKLVQEFRNFDALSPWEGMVQPDKGSEAKG
ncbi:NADH-quinone oxidoreductase subunit C [Rhodospirillaceae bacterium LM-1]|nr:NADH-quinone oxidoreductase subunit C [Rhodospirillaceae bacterium LM-1]